MSGLVLFINHEAKAVYDSIADLKEQMEAAENEVHEARKSLNAQVVSFREMSDELTYNINEAIEENRTVVAGIQATQSQFETRLGEVTAEARENLNYQLGDFRSVSEELSQNVNEAIEKNRNAVASIQTTQSQFETRLSEVTEEARENLNQQVANLQRVSEMFSQQIEVAMRENQNAVAGLMTTQSQFEARLSEVAEAKNQFQTLSVGLENMMEQDLDSWGTPPRNVYPEE